MLQDAAAKPEMAHIHEAFIHDINTDGKLAFQSGITTDSGFTAWYLERLGFDWCVINNTYVKEYIEYFNRIGYWRVNSEEQGLSAL